MSGIDDIPEYHTMRAGLIALRIGGIDPATVYDLTSICEKAVHAGIEHGRQQERALDAKLFVKFALQASWEGGSLDGCDIQDEAERLGLIVKVKYDPEKHGPNDYDIEPGQDWFVLSPELN